MVRARVFLDHKDLFIHGLQLNTDLSVCPLILAVCHARGIKHFLLAMVLSASAYLSLS